MSGYDKNPRLDKIIAEYLQQSRAGNPPDRQQLLEQHPELVDDLKSFFSNHDRVKEAVAAAEDVTLPPKHQDDLRSIVSEDATSSPSDVGTINASNVGSKVRYFGDYELLEEIARGGMGVVYKARQVKLNRIVALKMILSGQFASEDDVARFYTEAESAANLQHPNIVAIHDVGHYEGQHYFSMDYVEGESLADVTHGQPMPARDAAGLVRTLAEAIEFAHRKGFLHRDLKPSNVLIPSASPTALGNGIASEQNPSHQSSVRDRLVAPKITDFGLAKRIKGDSQLTGTGQIIGTPSYMPPEQAGRGEIGPASDVYALGAILYELVTGRPPFQAETPLDTLLQVLDNEPAAPRLPDPNTPIELENICLKCLEKHPDRRYVSAQELAADLQRFLNHEPIRARRTGVARRSMTWMKRRPWTITGVISLFVFVLVAYCYWLNEKNAYLTCRVEHPTHESSSRRLTERSEIVVLIGPLVVLGLIVAIWRLARWRTQRDDRTYTARRVASVLFLSLVAGIYAITAIVSGVRAHVWEAGDLQRPLIGAYWSLYLGVLVTWQVLQQRHAALFGTTAATEADDANKDWRAIGAIAIAVVLVVSFAESYPLESPRPETFVVAALVMVTTVFFFRLLLGDAYHAIRARPDLLVPVGILMLTMAVCRWLIGVPLGNLVPDSTVGSGNFYLGSLPEDLSTQLKAAAVFLLGVAIFLAIWTAYAAWQTSLLDQVLRKETVSLSPWRPIRRGFWRTLLVLFVGNLGFVLMMAPVAGFGLLFQSRGIVNAILVVVTVIWNLATIAVLPVALTREKGIHFLNGIRESWRLKNRLFLPVLAQLFIVGLFTVVHVRVDETTEAVRNSTRLTTIQCHPIWVGGYQNESQWVNDYTRAMPRGSVPVLKEIVGIVCLLMAVGMKIVVMQEMLRSRVTCQT